MFSNGWGFNSCPILVGSSDCMETLTFKCSCGLEWSVQAQVLSSMPSTVIAPMKTFAAGWSFQLNPILTIRVSTIFLLEELNYSYFETSCLLLISKTATMISWLLVHCNIYLLTKNWLTESIPMPLENFTNHHVSTNRRFWYCFNEPLFYHNVAKYTACGEALQLQGG